jgi:hypothetical protein
LLLRSLNRWNTQRRFSRLHLVPGLLLLVLDVSLIGGVAPDHVRANVEIWNKLLPDLIAFLRDEVQKVKEVNRGGQPVLVAKEQVM